MRPACVLLTALSLSCVAPAEAAPRRMELGPASGEVAIRAYGMGLFPIDGRFTRFKGQLIFDPNDRTVCRAELHVEVASLATDDPDMRDIVLGPEFMDAMRFPLLTFAGACDSAGMGGLLDMHGQAHPFALSLSWSAQGVVAEGRLERADWGMTARPLLGGRTVRIRVSVSLGA